MDDKITQQLLAIIGEEADIDMEIDQTLYPIPDWAVDQIVRSSGLIENICCHGIGHPHENYLKLYDADGSKGLSIHGCDGCCCPGMKEEIKKAYEEKEQSTEPFQELWDDNLRKKVMKEYDDRSNPPSIESGRCDKT